VAPAAGGFRRAPPGDVDGWAGDAGAGYPPAFLPPDFERPTSVPSGPSHKLQKVLADAGIGSRRAMETLIGRGAVTVNGRPATIGTRVMTGDGTRPGDVIAIDGRRIRARAGERAKVLLYHKPEGEIVSHDDPAGRSSVFDALPRLRNGKWLSVGRLDFNTSGLLIFTDSGEFANALMHPRFGNEREYAVRVMGSLSPEQLKQLTSGIELADGPARFESIHDGGGDGANRWYRVVVTEGRNRLVRRLFEANRLTVSRLMRVRFGPIELPSKLKRGQFLSLTEDEVGAIQARIERDMDTAAPAPSSPAPSRARERPRTRQAPDDLPPLGVPEGRPGRKRLDRRVPRAGTAAPRAERSTQERTGGWPGASARPDTSPRPGRSPRPARSPRPDASARPGASGRPGAKPRSAVSGRPAAPSARGARAPAGRPKTPGRSSRSR
jgi:23S rRNA pseudouridine2605 synthase